MDEHHARALLAAERRRVQALLGETVEAGEEDRAAADDAQNFEDPAERLTAEQGDDAVAEQLRDRLAAITRAEQRLEDGTFGRSVRSGRPIPDVRLEADPAAELTADEAQGR